MSLGRTLSNLNMTILVRKPNLEILTDEGIPKDFADVRDYFNFAIQNNLLSWIPRKMPITTEEIRSKWIPSAKTNICYIAELSGRVFGSATVFYVPSSTAYEHALQRQEGELASTTNPILGRKQSLDVDKELSRAIINELKQTGKTAFARIAIESPAAEAMKELGYEGTLVKNVDRYKFQGLSGSVFEYNLP